MNRKEAARQKIKEYFHRHTLTHIPLAGSLEKEEQRLRNEFYDNRILFRYNLKHKQLEVWYDDRDGLRCVLGLEPPFGCDHSVAKAIHLLRRRQRKARELLDLYNKQLESQNKNQDDKLDDLADDTADVVGMYKRGKVSTSARTI